MLRPKKISRNGQPQVSDTVHERTGLYSSISSAYTTKFESAVNGNCATSLILMDYSAPSDYCLHSPCSSVNMSLAKVFTNIRDPALFVDGFVQYEFNQLANFISTL